MRGADGETAEETRVPYLIIPHAGVAAEDFRKVSGEFAGWWVGIPRYGEEPREASILDGVDGTGGDDSSWQSDGRVSCVVRKWACLRASVRCLLLMLLKLRESAAWTKMKLWPETRCGNGRGERAFR